MRLSDAGLDMLKDHEGLRLNAYQDSAGVWTIGYGHTRTAKEGMKIDVLQAEQLLRNDADVAEQSVRGMVVVPLSQPMYDALVSFVFNLGGSAFWSSTLLSKINAEDYESAADEFQRWVWVTRPTGQKERLPGLEKRRAAEAEMFRSGIPSQPQKS